MKVWLLITFWAANALASQVPEVKASQVMRVDAEERHRYIAQVEANQEAVLSAPFPSSIMKVHVSLGTKIVKGQDLFSLEHLQPEFSMKAHTLKSPIGGEVADLMVKTGNQVAQDAKLIRIISPNDITVIFHLPQKDRGFVHSGRQGFLNIEGIEQKFSMRVASISSGIDALTGTSKATLALDEKNGSDKSLLKPGMVGRLTLVSQKRSVLAIPATAIFWRKEKFYTRVVKDGKAIQLEIKLGQDLDGDLKEIVSGLAEHDIVITNSPKYLRDGESVTIAKEARS